MCPVSLDHTSSESSEDAPQEVRSSFLLSSTHRRRVKEDDFTYGVPTKDWQTPYNWAKTAICRYPQNKPKDEKKLGQDSSCEQFHRPVPFLSDIFLFWPRKPFLEDLREKLHGPKSIIKIWCENGKIVYPKRGLIAELKTSSFLNTGPNLCTSRLDFYNLETSKSLID